MADLKISQLSAATTPLTGEEQIPAVQSGTTKKVTVDNILTGTVPSGIANSIAFLNNSKVLSTNASLKFNVADGTMYLGTATQIGAAQLSVSTSINSIGLITTASANTYAAIYAARNNNAGNIAEFWYGPSTQVGTIAVTSVATLYNTTSDYRLKDNAQPLDNSGAFIDALQPKTWTWATDGSRGVGFIAHEVQAVSPYSVKGEKDAVNAEGVPIMQLLEYGSAEFIANIIAELQQLRARVAQLESVHS
jgi:hypothetical protein